MRQPRTFYTFGREELYTKDTYVFLVGGEDTLIYKYSHEHSGKCINPDGEFYNGIRFRQI